MNARFSILILSLILFCNTVKSNSSRNNYSISNKKNIEQRDTILPDNDLIEYTGRIDFQDQLVPKFSFSGVSIRANFEGTSISAILNDDVGDNYYNIVLNGQVSKVLKVSKGKKEYILADGLEDKVHEVELFKRTELTFGKTQFYGFVIDEGKTLLPIINKRELFIEYIGNSITCGYGNEGKNGDDFLAETENHFLTYAAITSRNFNAKHMAVSRSGIGIYRNYNGPANGNDDCVPNLYNNIFLYDDYPKYDFTIQPDLVCINLGTNDFSTVGGDSALYTDNYFRLIDTIQTKYTNPEIICLLGSMMSGNTLAKVRGYLQFIADSATRKGKGNVTFFEMSAQTGDLGIGVHYHPSAAQHQKNAGELTEYIRGLMNWKVAPKILEAKTVTSNQIKVIFNTAIRSNDNFSGFSVANEVENLAIESITADDLDAKVLIVVLDNYIAPATQLKLNYAAGTIESADTLKLETVVNLEVNNTLIETTIKSSEVKTNGESIRLTFNKNLSLDSQIDGLSFSSESEAVVIDSFRVSSKYITCYISPNIIKDNVVKASYNGSGIKGKDDGVLLDHFSNLEVSNNSNITSIIDDIKNDLFKVWPNPNNKGVFFYKSQKISKANYTVLSANGSIISKGKIKNNEGVISLGKNVTAGLYFLKFDTNSTSETFELLVIN